MVKIYKQPFAHSGDAIAIPDESQPDGKISSAEGWTPDYQLFNTDPNYKPVGRQEMNGVFKEVTESIGQVQVQGAATWSPDGAPYPANAQVYYNGKQWIALRPNSVEPVEGEDWSAVMPQKTVTDALNTKADKATSINAGTGLTGGGTLAADLNLSVNYGTTAGTAAEGNDSRLSNSREWTATTISQAEAEAGTAITRRAFTAERVRQAIGAWFNGISGTIGRTILGRTTADQVRGDLELGTAATRDVGTGSGNVMEVGAFGLGGKNTDFTGTNLEISDFNLQTTVGFYAVNNYALDAPTTWDNLFKGSLIVTVEGGQGDRVNQFATQGGTIMRTWFRGQDADGTWAPWQEIHHTGNLLQNTGSSTEFPMSQKAVTDGLNTKADKLILETTEKTADYILGDGDQDKVVLMNKIGAGNLTVPTNAAVAFSIGTIIGVYNISADAVTIAGDTGVIVRNAGDLAQYGEVSLRKRATDEWVLAGAVS